MDFSNDNKVARVFFMIGAVSTIVVASVLPKTAGETTVCTYTFNVPAADEETCPQGATSDSLATLRGLLSNEHSALEAKLDAIAARLNAMTNTSDGVSTDGSSSGTGGATNYVRWGRDDCPDTATLIYGGHMGKSYYTHGGGNNYLCLPHDPEFPDGVTSGLQSDSYVYGVEYQRRNSPLIDESMQDHDAPCAVCETQGRSQLLMIPAKLTCPSGWTKEYQGLLMSQHKDQKPAEYVCVSDGMEGVDSGSPNQNGGLLYVVEAVCGSLPCPPFTNGYEIACVVCTK